MGWWIYLEDENGKSCEVDSHSEGGVIAIGGSSDAEMSLTYNYSSYYYQYVDSEKGIQWIDGKIGGETLERLMSARNMLTDNPSNNYWEKTPGNAGHALSVLISWVKQHPSGTWRVH